MSILLSLQHRAWLVPCHDELRLAHTNVTVENWVISWLRTSSSGQSLSYSSLLDGLSGEASHFSYWVNFRAIVMFFFFFLAYVKLGVEFTQCDLGSKVHLYRIQSSPDSLLGESSILRPRKRPWGSCEKPHSVNCLYPTWI